MDPQALEAISHSSPWKNALAWLGLLSGGTLALVLALYLWNHYHGRIPASNWFIAILAGFTTLGLFAALGISRSSLKEASLIAASGIACATAALLWGAPGIVFGLVAANVVTSLVAWRKGRASAA